MIDLTTHLTDAIAAGYSVSFHVNSISGAPQLEVQYGGRIAVERLRWDEMLDEEVLSEKLIQTIQRLRK